MEQRGEKELPMRKKIAAVLLAGAFALSVPAAAAGAITEGPGNGNPDLNGSGKCSPGQNKDTSVGGLKKCP
jgi:hypothetical protein